MDLVNSTEHHSSLHMTFTWYDYTLFSLMLGLSTVIGIYFGFIKKQSTASEYLLGGKTMKIVPIAISLTASNISGITLLAVPTDVYGFGATYWLYTFSIFVTYFVTYYVFLPVFVKIQVTSVYEYLKLRFSGKIRLLASFLFTISNILFLPIVIYIPALAYAQATGVNLHLITPLVCAICIFYTTIGGLKAVVWTDALQFVVMMGSMIAVYYMGVASVGGFSEVWRRSMEGKRLDIDFDPDPTKRDTFFGTLIGTLFNAVGYISIGQGCVQKYMSLPSMNHCKKALQLFTFGIITIITFSVLTGLIMYARYADCDPFSAGKILREDEILPYYVMDVATSIPGLAGLFMSGIFSAALSTLSATMNCLSGSIYEDFISPFMPKDVTQKRVSDVLKLIVLIIGIISTALVFLVEQMGSILPIQLSLSGITAGPLLGLFTIGVIFPMANSKGALYGGLGSLLIMTYIIVGSQLNRVKGFQYPKKPLSTAGCNITITPLETEMIYGQDDVFFLFKISYYYYVLVGTLLVLIIGLPVSYFTAKKDDPEVDKDLISPVSWWMMKKEKSKGQYYDVKQALTMVIQNDKK